MSDAPTPYRAELRINGQTLAEIFQAASSLLQEELETEMATILREQGWSVELPQKWESPKEISARLGITNKTFCRRMRHPLCPKPCDIVRDARGISHLRSHPVLDAFLTKNKPAIP